MNKNRIVLWGVAVGADAELKHTKNGQAVLSFSVAQNYKDFSTGKEDSAWFRCAVWGKRAESLAGKILKGDKMLIDGSFQVRKWTGNKGEQTSIDISVDNLAIIPKQPQQEVQEAPPMTVQSNVPFKMKNVPDLKAGQVDEPTYDDVPF